MYYSALRKKSLDSVIAEIRGKKTFTKLNDMSIEFLFVILLSEDKFFFSHKGYRLKGIYKAFIYNCQQRRIVTGGSTISQQLVKNMFFTFKRIYARKVVEIFAVRKLEKQLSKEEILELYCNCIEYGYGAYSIAEAAKIYFDTEPKHLTLKQSMMIAAVLPAPKKYDLINSNELFQKSLSAVGKLIVKFIEPRYQSYFNKNYNIPQEVVGKYFDCFNQEYHKRKATRTAFFPIYRETV